MVQIKKKTANMWENKFGNNAIVGKPWGRDNKPDMSTTRRTFVMFCTCWCIFLDSLVYFHVFHSEHEARIKRQLISLWKIQDVGKAIDFTSPRTSSGQASQPYETVLIGTISSPSEGGRKPKGENHQALAVKGERHPTCGPVSESNPGVAVRGEQPRIPSRQTSHLVNAIEEILFRQIITYSVYIFLRQWMCDLSVDVWLCFVGEIFSR